MPLWSLAVEEHFYLLWPAVLVVAGRKHARNVAAGAAMIVAIWRMAAWGAGWNLWPGVSADFRTDLRMDSLLWGCAVALLVKQSPAQFTRPGWAMWSGVAGIGVCCGAFYSQVSITVLAFLIPNVLAATVLNPTWRVSRLLECAPLVRVGRISYGIYLWQGLVLLPGWEGSTNSWQRFPANLVVLAALATGSYYLIERPVRSLGNRLASVRFNGSLHPGAGIA